MILRFGSSVNDSSNSNCIGWGADFAFQQALQTELQTEGVGLDKVIGYLKSVYPTNDVQLSRFLRLYEIAYDGMNDKGIWGKVISEIVHEVTSPGRLLSPLPKGFQFTTETQGR